MTDDEGSDDEGSDDKRNADAPAGRGQVNVPGQTTPDKTAAGTEQDGFSLDTVHASGLPAEDGINSSGDSVGDDESLPGADRAAQDRSAEGQATDQD